LPLWGGGGQKGGGQKTCLEPRLTGKGGSIFEKPTLGKPRRASLKKKEKAEKARRLQKIGVVGPGEFNGDLGA